MRSATNVRDVERIIDSCFAAARYLLYINGPDDFLELSEVINGTLYIHYSLNADFVVFQPDHEFIGIMGGELHSALVEIQAVEYEDFAEIFEKAFIEMTHLIHLSEKGLQDALPDEG